MTDNALTLQSEAPIVASAPSGGGASLGSPSGSLPVSRFWNFSLGMESSAMLWICRDEIKECGGHVVYADTGKQFPEAYQSLDQIAELSGLEIERVKQDYSFDEFLLERGGMLRQGYTDCSRRMKRVVLKRAHQMHPMPWEINLGYNAGELQRATDFSERNDVEGKVRWRFPLIESGITRAETVRICEAAGFTILLEMYRKMGRMDCYFCPNQKISQAQKVMHHYPELWEEWKALEKAKGHPFLSVSAVAIERMALEQDFFDRLDATKPHCSCFGGTDAALPDGEAENAEVRDGEPSRAATTRGRLEPFSEPSGSAS